jgi:tRNA 2-thiocytidine biosynthesis protein TtcA
MRTEEELRRDKYFKKLSRKAGRTMMDHQMLGEGDRILAGLSGGKDSLIMMEILADRIRSLPFKVELCAIHVSVEDIGYSINTGYLQDFCRHLEVPFVHKTAYVNPDETEKSACFICSWTRRKIIFNYSREEGFNKLAFGHHRDDALETFLMNLLYHGSISSLPYSLTMFDGRLKLVRPLLDLWESELRQYAEMSDFLKEEKKCPYDNGTKRSYTRELIDRLQADYPKSKINMFKAMGNIYGEYLPSGSKP